MDKAGKIAVLLLCFCLAVTTVCTVFFYDQNVKLKAKIQTLEQDKASLQSQVGNLQKEKASLQAQVHNLQDQYDQLQFAYNALKTNYTDLQATYNALEANYTKLQNDCNALKSDYADLQTTYNALEDDYAELQAAYNTLKTNYAELQVAYSTLKANYAKLQNAYEVLEANYTDLQSSYEALNIKYANLQDDYEELLKEYDALSAAYYDLLRSYETSFYNLVKNYGRWQAYLETYVYFTESFRRTLSDSEILSLVPLVESVVSDPNDWWRSVEELYDYIVYNIEYAYDEPFPVPPTISELENGNYENVTVTELFMSPSETLELGQGDCDDQAVLLYALIKAYNRHVYGEDYVLWIMDVEFEEEGHVAVAFPVAGINGVELTIVDPAGQYYTGDVTLTSNDPHEELEKYSEYWSEYGEVIKYIIIYEIYEGVAYEVVSGNIQEVADYIENC